MLLAVCMFPVQGGMIISQHSASGAAGHGGWNLDNITVNVTGGSYNESEGSYTIGDGTYSSDVDNGTGTVMTTIQAKDWPIGEPPGIKVINDDLAVKDAKPQNCIMATSYLEGHYLDTSDPQQVICSSGFQTHKRFKEAMLPAMVSEGNQGADLVFNVEAEAGSRDYQVFQKINNWTDSRLQGFKIEVGFGIGASFQTASAANVDLANLSLSVPAEVWDASQLAIFSHGLFGAPDKHFPDPGFFDNTSAGYSINEYPVAAGSTDTLTSGAMLAGDYKDVPPGAESAPNNQFGPWLPNIWLPQGIFFDSDDDPGTDDELVAWYGYNPAIDGVGWMSGSSDGFQAIPDSTIGTWSADRLYSMDQIDDLVNVGLNYIVSVGDVSTFPNNTFTIRITPVKDTSGTLAPAYAGKTPVPALINTDPVGVLTISSESTFTPGDVLEIYVSDGNVVTPDGLSQLVAAMASASSETETIVSKVAASDSVRTVEVEVTSTLDETEIIVLEEVTEGRGVFTGTLATVSGNQGIRDNNTANDGKQAMVAVTGTRLRVTYMDADNGQGGKGIPRTKETTAVDNTSTSTSPPVVSGGGGGGGCTVGNENRLSFGIPLLLIIALGIRRRLCRNTAEVIHHASKR